MSARSSTPPSVLITGASGYVGRLVLRRLLEDSRPVSRIVATDIRPPDRPSESGVIHHRLDVRDPGLAALLEEHRVDVVVHLACIVSPPPGCTREEQYSVDVDGTRNVLDACLRAGVGKIIVTSSGAAYGYHPTNDHPLDESEPIRGNAAFPYSHHKRLVEDLLAAYRAEHPELRQLVFRPGTILGPGTRNQITALFEKPVITGLWGTETPFVFIWDEDVAACVVEGVHTQKTGIYNLAGDGTVSLREIARRLGKPFVPLPAPLVRQSLRILRRLRLTRYGPEEVLFLQYRPVLSNRRLKEEFGYHPRKTSSEVFELYRTGRLDAPSLETAPAPTPARS